jgi:hypothetical protein
LLRRYGENDEDVFLLTNFSHADNSAEKDNNIIQHDDPPPIPTQQWDKIIKEVTNILKTTSPTSTPGPSGIGYTILKWAHSAQPEALTNIYNLYLVTGLHL